MAAVTWGEADLRAENVDHAVKAVAQKAFILRELCAVDSSSAWTETYYREDNADLVGGSGSNVKGIPRLAAFPGGTPNWTKVSSVALKYGMEDIIPMEDQMLDNLPVMARSIIKVGRAVANSEDIAIHAVMAASYGNTSAISAGYEWDSATVANRLVIQELLDAMQTMRVDNIDPLDNCYLVVNGQDYSNIMANAQVVNNPSFKTADVVSNGTVGQICGMKIKVTESIAADTAYIVKGKEAMVIKEAKALTVEQILDPGIKTTIRAYEIIAIQMVNPNACVKITNTRK